MKKFTNVLWGLFLIIMGVLIGLDSFEIRDINFFFDGWWSLFIIIPCAIEFFRSKIKILNLLGIATGVAILLTCQGIFTLEIFLKLSIPVILILLGIALVFKDSLFTKKRASVIRNSDKKGEEDKYSTFLTNKKIKYNNQAFYGNDLTATLGNITCDLRTAIINEDVIINANATCGNIEIIIPPTIRVDIKSSGLFGTVTDHRNLIPIETSPTVHISGVCFMGNVDIK